MYNLIVGLLLFSCIDGSRIIRNELNIREIIGIENQPLKIKCNAKTSISYCEVQHPNGTYLRPVLGDKKTEDLPYWYSGAGFGVGDCELNLRVATPEDNGLWKCYMGESIEPGVDIIESVKVRIGGSLAARNSVIMAKLKEPATVHCFTAAGNQALKYCRFVTPEGVRFTIDQTVTRENMILDRYHFKDNASLTYGDCAVSITKVTNQDLGTWKCAAMIDKGTIEFNDYVIIMPQEGNLSTASTTGIAIGSIVLVAVLGSLGYMVYRRRYLNTRSRIEGPASPGEMSVEYSPRPSGESDTSSAQLTSPGVALKQYGASTSTMTP